MGKEGIPVFRRVTGTLSWTCPKEQAIFSLGGISEQSLPWLPGEP
jgi:hypothetical protein